MPLFDKIQSKFISAYRSRYSSQHVLLRLIEEWRKCLDENKVVGAILMDLSKAFDCLPHDLLIAKLEVYELDRSALKLLLSYLNNRKQSVKVKGVRSILQAIKNGVPQGSILGPILFNIFLNDLHYVLQSDLHNFADDNTISAISDTVSGLVNSLTDKANKAVDWFHVNKMIVNPEKFKAILLTKSKENTAGDPIILRGHEIESEDLVTLLGVTIDYKLSFENHIQELCQRASAQLNALKRLGYLMEHKTRKTMVQSFILGHFNYCPLVWYFTSAKQINKIEKIQERALRYISDDYDSNYQRLLENNKFVSVEIKRKQTLCMEIFKTFNDLNPPYMKEFFRKNSFSYNLRSSDDLLVPRVNQTTFGLKSIRYEGAVLWNHLPKTLNYLIPLELSKSKLYLGQDRNVNVLIANLLMTLIFVTMDYMYLRMDGKLGHVTCGNRLAIERQESFQKFASLEEELLLPSAQACWDPTRFRMA